MSDGDEASGARGGPGWPAPPGATWRDPDAAARGAGSRGPGGGHATWRAGFGEPSSRAPDTHADASGRAGASPGPAWLGPGTRVGGAVLLAEVGRGAMGRVFRARDEAGRDVAVKLVLAGGEEEAARFAREGQAMAAIPAHHGVVTVHSAGAARGVAYLVMDFVRGESLRDVLRRGPLARREARALAAELARALAHVHRAGVVHRDLKPANVLVRAEDGAPLLTDFGLAALRGARTLTRTGDVLGTPLYMAPEQILGQRGAVGAPADVWALGCVLYEMVAGSPPFSGRDLEHLTRLITQAQPRPLGDPELDALLLAALAKDPAARPTAAELAEALAGADGGRVSASASGVAAQGPLRRRRQWLALGAGGALALLLALGAWQAWSAAARRRLRAARQALAERVAALDPGLTGAQAPPDPNAVAEATIELDELASWARADALEPELAALGAALRRARLELALASGRYAEAASEAAGSEGEEGVVLRARVALARGEPVDRAALRRIALGPDRRLAEAARLVLAAALASDAPAEALRLLEPGAIREALAAPLRRRLEALGALDALDLARLAAIGQGAPEALRRELGLRALRRLRTSDDARVARDLLEGLVLIRAPADVLARPQATEAAATVLGLVRELEASAQGAGPEVAAAAAEAAVDLLDGLARSGARPTLSALSELGVQLYFFSRSAGILQERHGARVLVALLRLDYPLPGQPLRNPALIAALRGRSDPLARFLLLRARVYQPDPDAPFDPNRARRELHAFLRSPAAAELGPRIRAAALSEVFDDPRFEPKQQEAIAEEALALDPSSPWAHLMMARVRARLGQREAALAAAEAGEAAWHVAFAPHEPSDGLLVQLVYVRAWLGDRAEVEALLARLRLQTASPEQVDPIAGTAEAILELAERRRR